jgi:hypothetical protein
MSHVRKIQDTSTTSIQHNNEIGNLRGTDKSAKILSSQRRPWRSAIYRLVQKYETLPVLPRTLTETQEKSAFVSWRRGRGGGFLDLELE